jgi:CheY-like chemotaxis protein
MRVLLVEDDRMAAMMVSSMLSDLGYQVEIAQNGAEAYALLREALPVPIWFSPTVSCPRSTGWA